MAAKKSTPAVPEKALELYRALLKTIPELEQKATGMPYTSANGNMYSFLDPEGALALRLDKAERETFLKKYKTGLKEQHGTVLKEYVAVPDSLFKNTKQLAPWFAAAFAYVQTLKAKPARR